MGTLIYMIKTWFYDIFNDTPADDVTVDIAKTNYQKYQDTIRQMQQEHIKHVCKSIRVRSMEGRTYFITDSVCDNEYMTYEFLMEMKEYFEQRGFKVEVRGYRSDSSDAWLKIIWE